MAAQAAVYRKRTSETRGEGVVRGDSGGVAGEMDSGKASRLLTGGYLATRANPLVQCIRVLHIRRMTKVTAGEIEFIVF